MKPVEQNIDLCDNIVSILNSLSDSDANNKDTQIAIEELETKTIALKILYGQIYTKETL
jgi:hypothetical protein